jgi:hypothetical protein
MVMEKLTTLWDSYMSWESLCWKFLSTELLYSQQGYEIKDEWNVYSKLNYINLPIMLKAYPSKTSSWGGTTNRLAVISRMAKKVCLVVLKNMILITLTGEWTLKGFKTNSGISLGVQLPLRSWDLYDEGKAQNRVWQFSVGFDLCCYLMDELFVSKELWKGFIFVLIIDFFETTFLIKV